MADPYPPTPHTAVRRLPERGAYDRATVHRILDEGLVCHVGFVHDGRPFVIPTAYARRGEELLIHGATTSRMLRALAAGAECCVTVTLVDGLVLARSAFHHSMNYRSVVVLGRARPIDEKLAAMRALTDQLVPGRWETLRPVTDLELRATAILSIPLEEVSAKVRGGPPRDDAEDLGFPVWAGVLASRLAFGPSEPDATLRDGVALPDHVRAYRRPAAEA